MSVDSPNDTSLLVEQPLAFQSINSHHLPLILAVVSNNHAI